LPGAAWVAKGVRLLFHLLTVGPWCFRESGSAGTTGRRFGLGLLMASTRGRCAVPCRAWKPPRTMRRAPPYGCGHPDPGEGGWTTGSPRIRRARASRMLSVVVLAISRRRWPAATPARARGPSRASRSSSCRGRDAWSCPPVVPKHGRRQGGGARESRPDRGGASSAFPDRARHRALPLALLAAGARLRQPLERASAAGAAAYSGSRAARGPPSRLFFRWRAGSCPVLAGSRRCPAGHGVDSVVVAALPSGYAPGARALLAPSRSRTRSHGVLSARERPGRTRADCAVADRSDLGRDNTPRARRSRSRQSDVRVLLGAACSGSLRACHSGAGADRRAEGLRRHGDPMPLRASGRAGLSDRPASRQGEARDGHSTSRLRTGSSFRALVPNLGIPRPGGFYIRSTRSMAGGG